MSLSYAHEHKRHVTRDKYITAPPFVIPCLRGTLLIFKAVDDLLFCHEAAFPTDSVFMEIKHIMGYRHAYVFRWLQLKRLFRKSDGSMLSTPALSDLAARRERELKSKRARERSRSLLPTLGI